TFRLLIHLICLIGCVWQIISISTLYFQYQTTVSAKFKVDVNMTLPIISICANRAEMVDRNRTKHLPFCAGNANSTDCVQQEMFANRWSIAEWNNFSVDAYDTIELITLLRPVKRRLAENTGRKY